ncbi:MAG: OsmC family protein [Pseudomonadota bacterium]
MAGHTATVSWERGSGDFFGSSFTRDHRWTFPGGVEVPASAAPEFQGNGACVDPEEAFVAALSSCHMLAFLTIAARRGLRVESYEDRAVGTLGRNARGRTAVVRVVLRPRIKFNGRKPAGDDLARLHESAHRGCFIANSVSTEVEIR